MIQLRTSDTLADDDMKVINDELRRFNLENNAAFFAARELPSNTSRPLYVVACDSEGRTLAGLSAETQLAWLKVSVMAVVPASRRQGIGSRLLLAAEAEAVARGCRNAYVDTMDYQAPAFYQKVRYRLAGRLDDWDSHGHAKFFFVKQLISA